MSRYPQTNVVFSDPGLFAAEMEQLFRRGWVFVGTDDLLAGPRSYYVYESAGRSLLICRDKDGALGAFVNSCSHRGTRLCRGPGQGKLQCPYHGWVFDTDGRLLGATGRKGLPPFDDAEHGLTRVSLEAVGRFLFVCDDLAPATPLRAALGEQAAQLEALSALLVNPLFELRMPIAGDWKLVVSGAIEDYHVPFVHGASLDPSRVAAAENTLLAGGHSRFRTPAPVPGWARLFMNLLGTSGREPHPYLENHLVFPNLLLVQIWNVLHVTTFVPLAPGRTLRWSRLYDLSPRRSLLHPLGLLRWLLCFPGRAGVRKVYQEDLEIVEEAELGVRAAPGLRRGPAHAEEARVEHFLAAAAAGLGYAYAPRALPLAAGSPPHGADAAAE